MKRINIGIITIAGILVVAGWVFVNEMIPSKTIKIYFPEHEEVLYLKKDNWGISGDKQITALSLSKWSTVDRSSENDYILEGLTDVFYRQDKDTLTLFVRRKFKLPKDFKSKIIVKQVELENPQYQDLYDLNGDSVKIF